MPAIELPVWTAAERESFFAAIDRHRRAAWQASAVAAIYLLVMVSIGLSGQFTFLPAMSLHALLR